MNITALCFRICLLTLGLSATCLAQSANKEPTAISIGNSKQSIITEPTFAPWVKKGQVQICVIDGEKGFYAIAIYILPDKSSIKLTASPDGLSCLIQEEVDQKEIKTFIKEDLPSFAPVALACGGTQILDKQYLESYKKDVVYGAEHPDDPLFGNAASLAILSDICSDPVVKFDKTSWEISMNLLYRVDGRVEHWTLRGSFDKFSVQSWTIEPLIEHGKIKPVLSITGRIY